MALPAGLGAAGGDRTGDKACRGAGATEGHKESTQKRRESEPQPRDKSKKPLSSPVVWLEQGIPATQRGWPGITMTARSPRPDRGRGP